MGQNPAGCGVRQKTLRVNRRHNWIPAKRLAKPAARPADSRVVARIGLPRGPSDARRRGRQRCDAVLTLLAFRVMAPWVSPRVVARHTRDLSNALTPNDLGLRVRRGGATSARRLHPLSRQTAGNPAGPPAVSGGAGMNKASPMQKGGVKRTGREMRAASRTGLPIRRELSVKAPGGSAIPIALPAAAPARRPWGVQPS